MTHQKGAKTNVLNNAQMYQLTNWVKEKYGEGGRLDKKRSDVALVAEEDLPFTVTTANIASACNTISVKPYGVGRGTATMRELKDQLTELELRVVDLETQMSVRG